MHTKPDSLIFDLDGTLWDAAGSCTKAWNSALKDLKSDHTVEEGLIRSLAGLKVDLVLKNHFPFVPEAQHPELFRLYKEYEKDYLAQFGGELYPGVKQTLAQLSRDYKLFIVSNCMDGYIETFLSFHQLQGLFIDFESWGRTGLPKNDNIKLIVQRNNLKQPVYIGDTIWDFESATKAGVPFIFAAYGFGKVEQARWKVEDFGELPEYLTATEII